MLTVALADRAARRPGGPTRHRQVDAAARHRRRRPGALVFVEGNAELTPARLIGQFDPAQVLTEGYHPETFVDGPLLTAAMTRAAGCSTSRSSTGYPRRR